MKEIVKITEGQLKILNILWKAEKPICDSEILAELKKQDIHLAYRTVSTFVGQLEEKGAVAGIKDQMTFYYYPLIEEKDFRKNEAKNLIKKHFGGSLKGFLAAFTGDEDLTQQEIEDMKEWVDKL